MRVKPLSDSDKMWVAERTELLFSGTFLVSRDKVHDAAKLPGFIADQDGERIGLVTYDIDGEDCEVVSIDALCQYIGVGTALLDTVERAARDAGCSRLWAITTNDNLDALRFFQRRGFTISAFRIDSMDAIRKLKPGIPATGGYGIAIRDEIELSKPILAARGWRTV